MASFSKLGQFMYTWVTGASSFIGRHKVLYYILNFTWGIIGTILGYILTLCLLPRYYYFQKNYNTYVMKTTIGSPQKGYSWGFSLGTATFVSKNATQYNGSTLYEHEFGHTCQNAVLGPFQLFLVDIPSMIRYWHRIAVVRRGHLNSKDHDDIWFEHSATIIGVCVRNDQKQ
jgi:hypothetical protein